MAKKLYKSEKDKKLAGVCGGIAEYFDVDSTIIRLILIFCCFIGAGIIAYVVAALVIPQAPTQTTNDNIELPKETPTDSSNSENNDN